VAVCLDLGVVVVGDGDGVEGDSGGDCWEIWGSDHQTGLGLALNFQCRANLVDTSRLVLAVQNREIHLVQDCKWRGRLGGSLVVVAVEESFGRRRLNPMVKRAKMKKC